MDNTIGIMRGRTLLVFYLQQLLLGRFQCHSQHLQPSGKTQKGLDRKAGVQSLTLSLDAAPTLIYLLIIYW